MEGIEEFVDDERWKSWRLIAANGWWIATATLTQRRRATSA